YIDLIGDFDRAALAFPAWLEHHPLLVAFRCPAQIRCLGQLNARGGQSRLVATTAFQWEFFGLILVAPDGRSSFHRVKADVDQRLSELAGCLTKIVSNDVRVGLVHGVLL